MTGGKAGKYRVIATSYRERQTGAYALQLEQSGGNAFGAAMQRALRSGGVDMRISDDVIAAARRIERSRSRRERAAGVRRQDALEREYQDEYTFQGRKGQRVVIDLRSTEFDPYVMLIGPAGKLQDNDDFEGDLKRSQISLELRSDGEYRVIVTSRARVREAPTSCGSGSTVPRAGSSAPTAEAIWFLPPSRSHAQVTTSAAPFI